MSLDRPVTFIQDIHGSESALRRSILMASGGGSTIDDERIGSLVLTGDLFNRGDQNVRVADTILALREKLSVTVLMGNHEAVMLEALSEVPGTTDRTATGCWLVSGGGYTLAELATRANLPPCARRQNGEEPIVGCFSWAKPAHVARWYADAEKQGWHSVDFEAAILEAKRLFLHGQFTSIIDSLQIMAEPIPGVRAVHAAGITDQNAHLTPAAANEKLSAVMAKREWEKLHDGTKLGSMIYRRQYWVGPDKKSDALSANAAQAWKEQNVRVLIHGHDMLDSGVQEAEMCHGVYVVNGDTGMSHGYPHVPNNAGYLQFDRRGNLIAYSSRGGTRLLGTLYDDAFVAL